MATHIINGVKIHLADRSTARKSKMLTTKQIEWAKRHDWFYADKGNGTIIVFDRYTLNGVSYEDTIVWDKSFQALRDWAGY